MGSLFDAPPARHSCPPPAGVEEHGQEAPVEAENSGRVIPAGSWPAVLQPFDPRVLPPGVLILVVVWTLVWKGLALWRAARAGQSGWFIVLLFVNTVGLLEIAYLLFFAGPPSQRAPSSGDSMPHAWPSAPTAGSGPNPTIGGAPDARP